MTLPGPEFTKARRLVAWEYAAANAGPDADGVVRGPVPFGASLNSSAVPIMLGSQGHIEAHFRWSDGTRPGSGLRKLFLYPELVTYYGTAVAGPNGDLNNSVPVFEAASDTRVTTAGLGAAFSTATPVRPMVYKPRAVAAAASVEQRIVGLELCRYRLEFWRATPDDTPTYRQAASAEIRLWGQEGQSFPGGMAVERPFYVSVGWEGEPDQPVDDAPFLDGDAITLIFRYGSTEG